MNHAPLELLLILLPLSVVVCAFFSAAEAAIASLNLQRLRELQTAGSRGARRARRLLKHPARLRSTLFFCHSAAIIAAAAIAALMGQQLGGAGGALIALLLLTPLLLVLAAVVPRNIGAHYPERIALPASSILMPLTRLLTPLIQLVDNLTSWLLERCGAHAPNTPRHHGDELRNIIAGAGQPIPHHLLGVVTKLLELEQLTVADVMVPRAEMFGIDLADSDADLIARLRECAFSRVPVWRDSADNVVGILHVRAIARCLTGPTSLDRPALMAEIYEPYYVPESIPLHTQLAGFQRERRRLGIVVDEYGGVRGLVTREDIFERVAGELGTDNTPDEDGITPTGDGAWLIDGTASVRDINRRLHWELPTEGPRTLSGLLLEWLEQFPEGAVGVQFGNYRFDRLELDGRVIRSARASRRVG